MCFTTGIHLFQFVDHFEWKVILCDVLRCLPQEFDSYDRQSMFDSVLHTETDDVLYGFSAIYVELITKVFNLNILRLEFPNN